ncbi:MAG: hypothetical protein AAFV98_17320 [Chloroflexota bacterium]
MVEYIGKAFSAWFLGFFPLAEIYIAVPGAIALGLDCFWQLHASLADYFSV